MNASRELIREHYQWQRKSFSSVFKAKVVLEVLKENKTIAQIFLDYGGHVTQINTWEKEALKGVGEVFAKKASCINRPANLRWKVEWLQKAPNC